MAKTTFSGPIQSLGGFVGSGVNNVVTMAAGTTALTVLPVAASPDGVTPAVTASPGHAGKTLVVADNGYILNLPIINATTPDDTTNPNQLNNLGMEFEVFLSADLSGGNTVVINTGQVADKLYGAAVYGDDGAARTDAQAFTAVAATVITFDATTRSGQFGSMVKCKAVAANTWLVEATVLNLDVSTSVTIFS